SSTNSPKRTMNKLFQHHSGEEAEHPPREMLLLGVDGELPAKEAAQIEAHLEACWHCRVKTKKLQEAIADIIEFDEDVLTPRILPPRGWRNFDRQLRELAAVSGRQSITSRLLGSLSRLFGRVRSVSSSHFLRPALRFAAAALVLILVLALVIHFKREPIVSASELLRHVAAAQTEKINSTTDAVVHQRLQVRRKVATKEDSVTWETWQDTTEPRFRQSARRPTHLSPPNVPPSN